MSTLSYKGHEVKFASQPTQADIDQTIAYLDNLGPKITKTQAAERGFLESALGMGDWLSENLPGMPDVAKSQLKKEALSKAVAQGTEAAKQHPVTTGIAGFVPKAVAAVPGALAVGTAANTIGAPALLADIAGGFGAGLVPAGGTQEITRERILQATGGDQTVADQAANAAYLSELAGFAAPAGIARTLVGKALSGAGINTGLGEVDVAIQNAILGEKYPELKQELFDPSRMALNAVTGGIAGPLGGLHPKSFTLSGMKEERAARAAAKQEAAMLKEMDKAPTKETLAARVKGGNEAALRGIENDIHASHEKADYYERTITKTEAQIAAIEKQLPTVAPEKVTELSELIEAKKAQVERHKTNLSETNDLIQASEAAYEGLSRKLGIEYRTPVKRAQDYFVEAQQAGSQRAINRAYVSGTRAQRRGDEAAFARSPEIAFEAAKRKSLSPKVLDDIYKAYTISGYNGTFAEFFAEQVAQTNKIPKASPIGKFVRELKAIIGKDASISAEDFVTDVVAKNFDKIEEIGRIAKEVGHVNATRLPLNDKMSGSTLLGDKPTGSSGGGGQRSEATRSVYGSTQEVVEAMKNKDDIDPTSSDLSSFDVKHLNDTIPLLQKIKAMGNPAVTYVVSTILDAKNRTIAMRNRLLGGVGEGFRRKGFFTSFKFMPAQDSWQVLSSKATAKDFYDIMQVFLKGQNRLDYEASLRMYGANLTDKQKKLYRATAKVYEDAWSEMNNSQMFMGKKHLIPNKMGYVAPVRRGDFAVAIGGGVKYPRGFSLDEEGIKQMDMSDTVHIERFFTEAEADAFVKKYNAMSDADRQGNSAKKTEKVPQIDNLFQMNMIRQMLDVAIESGADSSVIKRMEQMLREANAIGGTIGSHHKKQIGFLRGGMGTQMFASQKAQGDAFKDSIISYVKEITRQMEKTEISTKVKDLLLHPEMAKFEKTKEYLDNMQKYQLNLDDDNPFDMRAFKQTLDDWYVRLRHAFGNKEFHPQAHVFDSALGKTTHAFYLKALTSRPAFWAAQAASFTVGIRGLVRTQGIAAATKDMSLGFNRFMMNDKDLFDYFMWARENTGSLHPEFINDLTKFGLFDRNGAWTQKLIGYLSGETPSAAADSFSRAMAASFFFEHYSKKGLKGEQLYKAVTRDVDENMILYGKGNKAPIYQKMGVVGDLISPLSTFAHSQWINFANDLKFFIKDPAYQTALPAIATMLSTFIMGGTLGIVGAAEIELLIHGLNWVINALGIDYRIPTLWEMTLGSPSKEMFGTENKFIDRSLSHGFFSASTLAFSDEGFDIGSGLRTQPLLADIIKGDKTWADVMPVVPWAWNTAVALAQGVHSAAGGVYDVGKRRDIAQQLAPGWAFGFVDALKFGSFEPGPMQNKQGDPLVNKTPERAIARFIGTQTIDESAFKLKDRLKKEETLRLNEEAKGMIRKIALSNRQLTNEQVESIIKRLQTKYKKSPEQIFNATKQTLDKAGVSYEQMPFGKSFEMPSAQELAVEQNFWGSPYSIEEQE